jgi:hypothetical protein
MPGLSQKFLEFRSRTRRVWRRLRAVAHARQGFRVGITVRWEGMYGEVLGQANVGSANTPIHEAARHSHLGALQAERLLSTADGWQFDTWALQEATQGHALSALGFYLIQRAGLIKAFRIKPVTLARWVSFPAVQYSMLNTAVLAGRWVSIAPSA